MSPRESAIEQVPTWFKIYETLYDEIDSGIWKSGSRLPSEKNLCSMFSVTRMTVRRALQELQLEGLAVARKGSGVFVRARPAGFRFVDDNRFIDAIDKSAGIVSTKTLEIKNIRLRSSIARKMQVASGSCAICLKRLRLLDNEPFYYTEKLFPLKKFDQFEVVYSPHQSVMEVYKSHGVERYRRKETRVTGGFADLNEAEALNLSYGTPVLRTQSLNIDEQGEVIELNSGCYQFSAVELIFPRHTME